MPVTKGMFNEAFAQAVTAMVGTISLQSTGQSCTLLKIYTCVLRLLTVKFQKGGPPPVNVSYLHFQAHV